MTTRRIIILGGGFAGAKCAGVLSRRLPAAGTEIVLFNRENHLVFSPLLADAVGSSISLMDVVVPLRKLLPRVHCRTEDVQRIHPASNEIEYEGHDGKSRRMAFDHLVVACGTIANLNAVPGMADHGYPLKTVGDVAVLRSHVLEQLERAEVCDDPDRKRWYLSFVVVGGGYSGVEVAGEINDLVRGSQRFFKNVAPQDVSVTLIHSGAQLLPEIGEGLREFARVKMEKTGVRILLNTRVQMATPEGVGILDGPFVHGATVVCTVGTSVAPVIARFDVPKDRGRLLTEPDMRLQGAKNIWAIGDCASIVNGYDGKPSPPTGQFAERQGRQCALNIVRALRDSPTKPFAFKPLGQLCSIGGHSAVAEVMGMRLSGFLAWFTWRGIYLFKLPSWSRRVQVGFDWAWLLVFPRDLSHLKTDTTDRVSHAHYEVGDYVIRVGDSSSTFFIIEKGEVEVVRPTTAHPEGEVVAVMGPGGFFGERGLLDNRPRQASIRARTQVELLVVGKTAFRQMSETLSPLRQAIAESMTHRDADPWKDRPAAQAVLASSPVSLLAEPVPGPFLSPGDTLEHAARAFVANDEEIFYVVDPSGKIAGVVATSDLIRAQALGLEPGAAVGKFMTPGPVTVLMSDPLGIAEKIFRDHGIKTVPVVDPLTGKLAGRLRARRLVSALIDTALVSPNT